VLAPLGFWPNRLREVYGTRRRRRKGGGGRKRRSPWNLSVQYLVPGWDYRNYECADLALQGTLTGVYTHTIIYRN